MTPLTARLQPWLNTGLGLFYPEVCQLCKRERAAPTDGYVCPQCWSQVRFIRPPFCDRCGQPYQGNITTAFECANCRELELHFTYARAAVVYRTVVLEAIQRFKYTRARWFEPFLAGLLQREAVPLLRGAGWDWIAPVPLHSLREREREFNQAEIFARHLGAAAGIPLQARLLLRIKPTVTQTALTRKQRAANIRDAFALGAGLSPAGKRVVLVDDVLTTGATTNACARVLRRAGAAQVCVWTVARGL